MYLVQILLPLFDQKGERFGPDRFARVRTELVERFGGLTAYTRAPATGLWVDEESGVTRDEIVVYEVMVQALDREWWRAYREALRKVFEQEELVVRAQVVEML